MDDRTSKAQGGENGGNAKKAVKAVPFTENSPIWESRSGSLNFMGRAWLTFFQFANHPVATFAAPKSKSILPALKFYFTCAFVICQAAPLFKAGMLSAFPERVKELPEALTLRSWQPGPDGMAGLILPLIGALCAIAALPVIAAAVLHLLVILFSPRQKGFRVSLQIASYSLGVFALAYMVVYVMLWAIIVGWPTDFLLLAGKGIDLLFYFAPLLLFYAGLLGGHRVKRTRANVVIFIMFMALSLMALT